LNLTGTATTSQNVNISSAFSNNTHPLVFTPSLGTSSGAALSSSSTLSYNPNTDTVLLRISVTSTTASTSTSTGALIVSGGVGIGGSLYTATSSADRLFLQKFSTMVLSAELGLETLSLHIMVEQDIAHTLREIF